MSTDPGLRWQRSLRQIAPDLRCPPAATQENPSADACSITASSTVHDVVVVSVQRGQRAELIGLSQVDGAIRWRKRAPAGSTHECMVTGNRLWCLTVPLIYLVVTKEVPADGGSSYFSVSTRRSAAYHRSALIGLDPDTGVVLHSASVLGSGGQVAFAGTGFGGFYLLGYGSDSAGTVLRFSDQGVRQWSHQLTLISLESNFSTLTGRSATPQVRELNGRALVSRAEVAGRQAVFSLVGGAAVRSAPGHVVTVLGTTVVTQIGGGGLNVGGRTIPENAMAVLSADDRATGEPVMATRFSATASDSVLSSDSAVYVSRAAGDPLRVSRTLQAGDEPIAYCAGTIITVVAGSLAGYDRATGSRHWVAGTLNGNNPQVRCSGSQVIVANERQANAYSVQDGKEKWGVTYPLGSLVTNDGYGDPSEGLVLGPSADGSLPTGTTSMSYLR